MTKIVDKIYSSIAVFTVGIGLSLALIQDPAQEIEFAGENNSIKLGLYFLALTPWIALKTLIYGKTNS